MSQVKSQIKSLGLVIKKQRQKMKLSQTQLAQLAGVSLNFVSQVESGKPRVQFLKLLEVLFVLGIEFRVGLGSGGLLLGKFVGSIKK